MACHDEATGSVLFTLAVVSAHFSYAYQPTPELLMSRPCVHGVPALDGEHRGRIGVHDVELHIAKGEEPPDALEYRLGAPHNARRKGVVHQGAPVGGAVQQEGGGAGREEAHVEGGRPPAVRVVVHEPGKLPFEEHQEQAKWSGPDAVVEQQGEGVQPQLVPQLPHDDHVRRSSDSRRNGPRVA
eukprot:scaffold549_cov385-Prasinococcus_capsulatus_cf.AAC.6